MQRLVVYYSHTSNNELLAYKLQKDLSCDILEIEEAGRRTGLSIFLDIAFNRKPRLKEHNVLLEDYDEFIFVAPIWAGKIASPLRAFLLRERRHIMEYSFITLCGGGDEGQADKITKELTTILGRKPHSVEELWMRDLLLGEGKKNMKFPTGYKVFPEDLETFKVKMREFVNDQRRVNV